MPTTADTLEQYRTEVVDIDDLYVARAKMQNAILTGFDAAYKQAISEGLSYNPAVQQAKSHVVRYQEELNTIQGDIDGKLTLLRYLDQVLQHANT